MEKCLALAHSSWKPLLQKSILKLSKSYLTYLSEHSDYLPSQNQLFRAFSRPLNQTRFVLFGESPYPRESSANGFAFWDAEVNSIWSDQGLSKPVNRATSLRNLIKMLCLAEKLLTEENISPENIANINKSHLIQTNSELFENLLNQGFLLLNASLVLRPKCANSPKKDLLNWQPFMQSLLYELHQREKNLSYVLFGRLAKTLKAILPPDAKLALECEHPYNLSFIKNKNVLDFFKPFHLLIKSR